MTWDPSKVVFTDCETTGLDVFRHDAWEISWIVWDTNSSKYADDDMNRWVEATRTIWPPSLQDAEPMALSVNQFYQRTRPIMEGDRPVFDDPRYVAEEMAYVFAGKHVIGACPWFDDRFYQKFLMQHGYQIAWHYHLLDVEAAALGYMAGLQENRGNYMELPFPWKSDWLAEQLGMTRPEEKDRHTSLGDTREVKQVFERIFGPHHGIQA